MGKGQGGRVGAGVLVGYILGYLFCLGFMFLQKYYSLISGSVYKIDQIQIQLRLLDLLIIGFSTIAVCLIATYSPALRGSRIEVIEGLKDG